MWGICGGHSYPMLSSVPLLIIAGSLDSRLPVTNNRDREQKSFSVLRKLGKYPNLCRIVVTLIPLLWHFSLKDVRLQLGGILKKRPNLAKNPQVVIMRDKKGAW